MAGATPKALKAADDDARDAELGINAGIVPGNLGGY